MNEIYFILNGNSLILDEVLIECDGPIFYVCRSNEKYYLVHCINIEKEEYYIAETELNELNGLVNGKVPMRYVFLNGNTFWDVKAGKDPSDDDVKKITNKELDKSCLPKEGALFEMNSPELEEYGKVLRKRCESLLL